MATGKWTSVLEQSFAQNGKEAILREGELSKEERETANTLASKKNALSSHSIAKHE